MLRIHPHGGDTLRMKMDQHVEISGDAANAGAPVRPMSASMRVCTRAVVLQSGAASTELLSITDSVIVTPSAAATLPLFVQTKRALEGKHVRLRVATNGAMTMPAEGGSKEAKLAPGEVPPVLPEKAVAPGDSWVRDLPVPLSATSSATGLVHATFRLDSLGPDGAIAYLSMQGTFTHEHSSAGGAKDKSTGTISGTMQIDRRIEWITDSRTTVTLISTLTAPAGGAPMVVHTKVTQWLRAVPPG